MPGYRYSAPHSCCCLERSLSTSGLAATAPSHLASGVSSSGDRFPRSMQEPKPSSRHLHAGHHLAGRQVSARLIPEPSSRSGFDVVLVISTRQQWFTRVRLLGSHLTRSRRAFSATLTTSALDRRSLRWFGASPCRAAPEGQTSISCTVTHTQVITILYIVPYLPALVAHALRALRS